MLFFQTKNNRNVWGGCLTFLLLVHPHTVTHAITQSIRGRRTAEATIIGHVDSVQHVQPSGGSNDVTHIYGWGCEVGVASSVQLHVYAGGPAGAGSFVKAYPANLPSEAAVNTLCQGELGYRYRIPISLDEAADHGGESIYVHAVGRNNQNNLLVNSGKFHFPKTDVRGFLDIVKSDTNGNILVHGWACQGGLPSSIAVKLVVAGGSSHLGAFISEEMADLPSEQAVSARCQTSSVGHRYTFKVPETELALYSGHPVLVYGISADATEELLLSSQQFTVPAISVAKSTTNLAQPLSSLVTSSQADIIVPEGSTYYLDSSIAAGLILVQGTLQCPTTTQTLELRTNGIVVAGSNGSFVCGSSSNDPSSVYLDIILTGNRDAQEIYGNQSLGPKAIVAVDGGSLRLHGPSGREGYRYLQAHAVAGRNWIKVDAAGWEVGDTLVITSSDYDPSQAEECTITGISPDRDHVTLAKNLKHFHWGSTQSYSNGKGQTWVLDERAEVFNLKRSIRVSSENDALARGSLLGAHVIIRGKESSGYIDNVEFYRVGQAGEMGRYPFHWHFAGDVHGQYIRNSSIHHSFQRCVVIHQSNHATVQRNTCYNHFGHGFFLEAGNEVKNTLVGNLGALSRIPDAKYALLQSDITGDPLRFAPTSTYWISHPDNTVVNNVAAGSEGSGFWMAFVPETDPGVNPPATPLSEPTLAFHRNRAHSSVVGITHDGAPMGELVPNPNNPKDHVVVPVHYSPNQVPVFQDLVAFKCSESGLYFRGDRAVYRNAIVADNKRSIFFTNDQELIDSLVVGQSSNRGSASLRPISGVMVYDGPLWLENVHFAEFTAATTMAIDKIGAARLWTDQFQGLTFERVTRRIRSYLGHTVWSDEMCSSVLDVDGSLTGSPGQLVVPDHAWNSDDRCRSSSAGEFKTLVCDYKVSYLWFQDLITGQSNELGFYSSRIGPNQGTTVSIIPQDFRNKLSMIQGDTYRYSVDALDFSLGARYLIHFLAQTANLSSPLVTFVNFPSYCRIHQTSNNRALRNAWSYSNLASQRSGVFRQGSNLVVKFATVSENARKRGDTFRGEGSYTIEC